MDREPNLDPIKLMLAKVLQYGLMTSLFLVSMGGFQFLEQHGSQTVPAYATLIKQIPQINPIKLSAISDGLRQGDGIAYIELGLFLLVATPILRVSASICAFAIRKEATYSFLASTVLVILFASLIFAPQ